MQPRFGAARTAPAEISIGLPSRSLTLEGRPPERVLWVSTLPAASLVSGVVVEPVSKFRTRSETGFFV